MRLRRQRRIGFQLQKMPPVFLRRGVIAIERRRLPKLIKRLRHIRLQFIRAHQRGTRLVKLSQLQQRFTQTIRRQRAPRLKFRLQPELFFSLVPLLRTGIEFAEIADAGRRFAGGV